MGDHWALRWLVMLAIFALSTMAFSYASAAPTVITAEHWQNCSQMEHRAQAFAAPFSDREPLSRP